MDKPKKATKGQIGRIVAMLTSGHIPFEEAQGIIERHAEKPARSPRAVDELFPSQEKEKEPAESGCGCGSAMEHYVRSASFDYDPPIPASQRPPRIR